MTVVVPPDSSGDGAGAVIIGRNRSAEGHIQMGVNIHPTGHHQQAGSVDDGMALCRNVVGDPGNGLALEEHIGAALAVRIYHRAVLDQRSHVRC